MREVSTHEYDPNKITACTTALKDIPETLGLAPSCTRILASRAQLFYTFRRLPTTVGQLSSAAVKTRPRYLNEVTVARDLP